MRGHAFTASVTGLLGMILLMAAPASAHQPVNLGPGDASPATGPLLVDGTVSFAVRAKVAKGQERGFRVALKRGDRLAAQLLILDQAPANQLAVAQLPRVTIIDPKGRRTDLTINERTTFFEPYSKTTYLFLSRTERAAVPGTYQMIIQGRAPEPVDATVAVGYREVRGTVID